jgi:hypothetical protein
MGPGRSSFIRVVAVAWLAAMATAARAQTPPCPSSDGCIERCAIGAAPGEEPSDAFVSKLKSISRTAHHIDTRFGAALLDRRDELRVGNVGGLGPAEVKLWEVDHRYAGPCAGLAAVFRSRAVEDHDDKNVVDLYELRYPTEKAAARVAGILARGGRVWDWNYHPFAAVQAGRSVIVIEGRWRAWSAFRRVAEHFGATLKKSHR